MEIIESFATIIAISVLGVIATRYFVGREIDGI